MTAVPTLQSVLTQLIDKHQKAFFVHHNDKRLRLEMDGLARLIIVVSPGKIALAREEIWDGEAYCAPEIHFFAGGKQWTPIYSSHMDTLDHYYAKIDHKTGTLIEIPETQEQQAQEAFFCEEWARTLQEQNWLEHAVACGSATAPTL